MHVIKRDFISSLIGRSNTQELLWQFLLLTSFELAEIVYVHGEQWIDINIVCVKIVTLVLLDALDDALDHHIPLGHVSWEHKCKKFARSAFLILLLHVSEALLRLLEIFTVFRNQTIAVQEEFLNKDVVWRQLKLIILPIIKSFGWSCLWIAWLPHVRLISLEEAHKCCVLLRSLPEVHKVLETSKELNDSSLNLVPYPVLLSEENDQVLFHRHVRVIDHAIDLRSMLNPMIVDLINKLLELRPNCQSEL